MYLCVLAFHPTTVFEEEKRLKSKDSFYEGLRLSHQKNKRYDFK